LGAQYITASTADISVQLYVLETYLRCLHSWLLAFRYAGNMDEGGQRASWQHWCPIWDILPQCTLFCLSVITSLLWAGFQGLWNYGG